MSNWIERESEEFRAKMAKDAHARAIINISNYWAALVLQVEHDVVEMNKLFADVLIRPVEFVPTDSAYKIVYSGNPAVAIRINNGGEQVTVETSVIRSGDTGFGNKTSESLKVVSDGDNVYLMRSSKDRFLVPQQASQFILLPIIDSLR